MYNLLLFLMMPLTFAIISPAYGNQFLIVQEGQEQIQAYVSTPDTLPHEKLASLSGVLTPKTQVPYLLTVYWSVEGRGTLWLEADNAGQFYQAGTESYLLNYEFARSRTVRNRQVMAKYVAKGFVVMPSGYKKQVEAERLLVKAQNTSDLAERARISDLSLKEALIVGDQLELGFAYFQQQQANFQRPIFGVDSRHYLWSRAEEVDRWVPQLFEYGTITHYVSDSWFPHFEPKEGDLRWGTKIELYDWLHSHGMGVEARPVLWPHEMVTPAWLKNKNFDELKIYTVNHATAMVKFWGNRIKHWEVANEMHDWANVHNLSAKQITEIIKLACATIRRLQPDSVLIINNTMPFGEYAGMRWGNPPAARSIRTPYLFIRDLIQGGVDFDIIGLQIYHPERDLSDLARLMERFETFGKKIIISEVSAPGGATEEDGQWKGNPWSQTTQADWAEDIYRVLGSRSRVYGIYWYDITDFRPFVPEGGVLTEDGQPKEVFHRLLALKKEWASASHGKRKVLSSSSD